MERILHIPKFYAPNDGGIEKMCKSIVDHLPGYNNQVICFSDSASTYTDVIDGVTVHRIGSCCIVSSQNISFSYFFRLKKLVHDFRPDLIHFHAPNPLVMFYVNLLIPKTCKLIVHWHSDIVEQKTLYRFVKQIEHACLKRADCILTTSKDYADSSNPLKPFIDKVSVLPSAIDPDEFSENKIDKTLYQRLSEEYGGKKIVFFVGRHVPYKGLTYLIQAEKFIKNDCLILLGGTGPLTEKLKAESSSPRIRFLGRLSESELLAYLYIADIFALPSITKNEAFGLVLVEAMYCYTPPVTFTIDGSGVNWVNLHNQTGLEVENMNVQKYAEAIDLLLADDALRSLFSENARQRVCDHFILDRIIKSLKAVYDSLLYKQ